MNDFIIRESSTSEADLIIDRLVEYNLSKVSLKQQVSFSWINRCIEDKNGEIIAGILSKMYCWNCLYIDVLWVQEGHRKEGLGSKLLNNV